MYKKNETQTKQKILVKKLVILYSYMKPSFKTYILSISDQPFSRLSVLIFLILIYLIENSSTNIWFLFEKNVPGVFLPSHKITWDTFQKINYFSHTYSQPYSFLPINDSQKILENQLFQNEIISINYDGTQLTFKLTDKWNSYKKQYLLGIKNVDTPKFSSQSQNRKIFSARDNIQSTFYSNLILNSKNRIPHQNFYYLDEFPLKCNHTWLQTKNIYFDFLSNSQLKNITFSTFQSKKSINLNHQNNHSANQQRFQTHLIKTRTAIKTSFYQNGYLYPFNSEARLIHSKSIPSFLKKNFRNINAKQILNLSDQIRRNTLWSKNQQNEKNKLWSVRESQKNIFYDLKKVSGFQYPDMTKSSLAHFQRRNLFYSKWVLIKKNLNLSYNPHDSLLNQFSIYLGHHFSYPRIYRQLKPQLELLKFQYYLTQFEDENNSIRYKGPTIVWNNDQVDSLKILKQAKISKNLSEIFNKNNPNNFNLGSYFSNKKEKSRQIIKPLSFFTPQKSKFVSKSSEKDPSVNIKSLSDYDWKYVVPHLNSIEWQTWLQNLEKKSAKIYFIESFPIRILSTLRTNQIEKSFENLDYQNSLDTLYSVFKNSPENSKATTSFFFYNDFFNNESSFSSNFIRKYFMTISSIKKSFQYEEIPSNSFQKLLFQIDQLFQEETKTQKTTWEPFHYDSWLIFTQFLYAIFTFYFLKQFRESYGQELISYFIYVATAIGVSEDLIKDEFLSEKAKFRIIKNSKIRFKNIAGIESIFIQLAEIVRSLRISKMVFWSPTNLPNGILLVGPPGTGKTLLVKAMAGEADIPIFMQPTGLFNSDEIGSLKLQHLFEKAKQIQPCILFFDEIDSIGQRRKKMLQNVYQNDCLFTFIGSAFPFSSSFVDKSELLPIQKSKSPLDSNNEPIISPYDDGDKLSLLMQLLIELDGIRSVKKVLVMGATNRVDVLDQALIRPGRFEKIFHLNLPLKEKRIKICQLYASTLGSDSSIHWNSIGNQTMGLSGADLAAIMNQSSINGIINSTKHTMETIEFSIEKIIGDTRDPSPSEYVENVFNNLTTARCSTSGRTKSHVLVSQYAYYQGSQTVIEFLLRESTPILSYLFPKSENYRYQNILSHRLSKLLKRLTRQKFEDYMMTFFAGKIGELSFLHNQFEIPNSSFWHSDLGFDDLKKGNFCIYHLVHKWGFYSNNRWNYDLIQYSKTENELEFNTSYNPYTLSLDYVEHVITHLQINGAYEPLLLPNMAYQQWANKSGWQIKVTEMSSSSLNINYATWYRIYLKNPDESTVNDEWLPPDVHYHQNHKYFLTKTFYLHNLILSKRDSISRQLLNAITKKTFRHIYNSSEFIDFFVSELLQRRKIRDFEIESISAQFFNY